MGAGRFRILNFEFRISDFRPPNPITTKTPRHQDVHKENPWCFLGVLVPSWLRRFVLTNRKATVTGHGRAGLEMPRSRRRLAAPVAVAVAAL
jgi:hypothetical protein